MSLSNSINILLCMENNFNKQISDTLFHNLSDHLWEKWIHCDGNILKYITRLDKYNKYILLKWGSDTYS